MQTEKHLSPETKSTNNILDFVAHDFKGMMQQISSLNSMLRSKTSHLATDEINRIFEYIDQVCMHGNAITNDLLEAGELETTINLSSEVHSLNRVIAEQAKMYALHANEKQIIFHSILPNKQFFFELNRSKFIRALDNLFFNALRFTEAGGEIRIVLSEQEGKALIKISDSGNGIPQELQNEIFRKYSGAKSYGSKHTGRHTGLGLYIVKQIIELHKGNIWFTTNSKGTSFFIELKSGIIL